MLRNRFALCAELAILDQRSRNMSAVNILEELTPEGFPALRSRLFGLAAWERDEGDPEDYDGRFLLTLGEQELMNLPLSANFQGRRINRTVVELAGIILTQPGPLTFAFQLGDVRATYSVQVNAPTPKAEIEAGNQS